jgi:hypothetical protein
MLENTQTNSCGYAQPFSKFIQTQKFHHNTSKPAINQNFRVDEVDQKRLK